MMQALRVIALLSLGVTSVATAQGPGGAPAPTRRAPAAQMLLSHVGELELTDAQVVRLAAIARRSEARRRSMRAALDSARTRFEAQPGDTAARRQFRQRMQSDFARADEQSRTDQRDAIAVLNADQQAKAWDLAARRGPDMRRMAGSRMRRGPEGIRPDRNGMRRGPGGRGVAPRPDRPMERPFRDERRPLRRQPLENSE
jgi:hypothetical protein